MAYFRRVIWHFVIMSSLPVAADIPTLVRDAYGPGFALCGLSFYSGVQPSEWNKNNFKTIFGPIMALHALEHLGCGHNDFGRWLTGDTNNPNQKASLAFYLGVKMLYHMIPSLLQGRSVVTGVKRFFTSGHLAQRLLVTPMTVRDKKITYGLWFSAVVLIVNQVRAVYALRVKILNECKKMGIKNPFEQAFFEPSATHVKLPRYLTQDLALFLGQAANLRGFTRDAHCKHFNKEFKDANDDIHMDRTLNPNLLDLQDYCRKSSDLNLKTAHLMMVPLITVLARVAQFYVSLFGTAAHALGLMLDATAKGEFVGDIGPSFCDMRDLFISQEMFQKLSSVLQDEIKELNEQELIFKAYNLFNPLTEHAFALAQYTHQTEAQENDLGGTDYYSSEWIRMSRSRHRRGFSNRFRTFEPSFYTKYEYQNFHIQLVLGEESKNKPGTNLNYKEQSLWYFIPFAQKEDPEGFEKAVCQRARDIAKEVLKHKPVSYLAKKTLELTADLELS